MATAYAIKQPFVCFFVVSLKSDLFSVKNQTKINLSLRSFLSAGTESKQLSTV